MGIESNVLNLKEEEEQLEKAKEAEEEFLNLLQEANLPPEQRSEKFKQLLEEKYNSLQGEENLDEDEGDFIVRRYLNHFHVKEEDLKDKTILDVGCGLGDFVKHCLDKNITNEAYGFDLELNHKLAEGEHKNHLQEGDFTKEIPFQDKKFDYILAYASLEGLFLEEQSEEAKKVFESLLALLKDGGEIRVYPLRQIPPEIAPEEVKQDTERMKELLQAKEARKRWEKTLQELKEQGLIDYKIQPIDIRVLSSRKEFWLEELLIITKIDN